MTREDFESYVSKRYVNELAAPQHIANELGCSRGKIVHFLKRNNLLREWVTYVDDPSMIQKVLKLYENPSYSTRRVAAELGIYEKTVAKILKRNGVKIFFKKLLDEDSPTSFYGINYEEMLEYFKSHTYKETAEYFNCSYWLVWDTVHKAGETNRQPSYTYFTDYFDSIDNHEKAFILGLLATDGNTFQTKTSLTLKSEDAHLLEDIIRLISPDKPITFYNDALGKQLACLTIYNKEITDRLVQLGIVNQKTFKLKVEDWMTGEFCNSAIGGMIAGDGSIGFCFENGEMKKPIRPWIEFVGMKEICEFILDSFEKHLGIKKTKVYLKHNYENHPTKKSIYALKITAHKDVKKILLWIFKDSKLVMNRKFEKAKLILEELEIKERQAEERAKLPVLTQREKNQIKWKKRKEKMAQIKLENLETKKSTNSGESSKSL